MWWMKLGFLIFSMLGMCSLHECWHLIYGTIESLEIHILLKLKLELLEIHILCKLNLNESTIY